MGNDSSRAQQDIGDRLVAKIGKIPLSGRYHRHPNVYEDKYETTTKVLGRGFSGAVMLATRKDAATQERFAVKTFNLTSITSHKKTLLEKEVQVYLLMDHPHITRLFDVYESKHCLHLVMECMEGGELYARLTENSVFREGDAADVTYQMLLALNYIHSHDIIHRDIKLENFLYDKKGSNHLKLIDFGFSEVWKPNSKMQVSLGTFQYVAPEVLKKAYTSKCDVWSLGVVVFILLAGYLPFSGNESKMRKNICLGNYILKSNRWQRVSNEGLQFVKSLLNVNPDERPSAQMALESPWITQRYSDAGLKVDSSVAEALRKMSQASKFRRHCLGMMAWSLSNEEQSKVRQDFLSIDKEKNGTISLLELRKAIEDAFDITDDETRGIFQALDTNNDEEIHYTDFLAAMVSTRLTMHDDLLQLAFDRFDVDNSGYITIDNVRDVLDESHTAEEISMLLAEADQLQDGRISYAEFVSYLRGDPLERHAQAAEVVIDLEMIRENSPVKLPSLRRKEEKCKDPKTSTGHQRCCTIQ